MKVKYIGDRLDIGFKLGSTYKVYEDMMDFLSVKNDLNEIVNIPNEFVIRIHDTPQIEVGSEWVATLSKQGEKTLIVLHVGQQMSLCKWVSDDREFSVKNTEFNTAYKPKPKTVTMYFYKLPHGYVAYSNEHPFDTLAFTKEIEL